MINVWIPYDKEYLKYREECKKLYENVQDKICDTNSFEFIEKNTYFVETESGLEKFFLNGFAKKKKHQLCLECLKTSLGWFIPPIYAEAQNRASALCLLKCGFKRTGKNIFVYTT